MYTLVHTDITLPTNIKDLTIGYLACELNNDREKAMQEENLYRNSHWTY